MFRPLSLFFALAASAVAGDAKSPITATASSGDWEFSLSAGAGLRHSGTYGFLGGSRSANVLIPSFVGDNSLVTPDFGTLSDYGPRTYQDGFVNVDSSTPIDGLTSHWGYENSGQVDVAADLIRFHATGFQSIRSDVRSLSAAPFGREREISLAPVFQLDARYKREIAGIRPGFSMFFSCSPADINRNWSDFSLTQNRNDFRHDWTDAYHLGGLAGFIPSAPYSGAPDSPGFLLENLPGDRELISVLIGSENALITNQVSTKFHVDHSTLSFGPTIAHRIDSQWNLEAGLGLSLHWLRWSASQRERLSVETGGTNTLIGEWRDTSSGNKVLAGLYLQFAVEWEPAHELWSIKGLLRSDVGQKFNKAIGPSSVYYDPDGLTAALLLTYPL